MTASTIQGKLSTSFWNRVKLGKTFLYEPCLVHKSLYVVALRFPLIGAKGQSPSHEKQPRIKRAKKVNGLREGMFGRQLGVVE